jgi:2-polyprenyl-3-methyl-5-hydroxy-6-metoxy-1,4-benzoquinol methylase
MKTFRDDPARDYRRRYWLPDQFVWDVADWPRIDFDGYVEMALGLLPEPPARVLDVGCGPGAGSERLARRGYDVTGVDYNDRAVAFARLMVEDATFVAGDVRALAEVPGLARDYDAAWCIEVFEHVPPEHRPAVVAGIAGRLRTGGVLVLTTPSPRMHGNVWDYPRASLDGLRAILEHEGLRVTRVRFQHRITPWFSPAAWRLVSNRFYDLRAGRHLLRRMFLRRWNEAPDEAGAGRFVIRAERAA